MLAVGHDGEVWAERELQDGDNQGADLHTGYNSGFCFSTLHAAHDKVNDSTDTHLTVRNVRK
jgi:hypothetical protein